VIQIIKHGFHAQEIAEKFSDFSSFYESGKNQYAYFSSFSKIELIRDDS
jgi:hypothetical protein